MKRLAITCSLLGATLATGRAHAEFGNPGDVSFGADRLSGIYLQGAGNVDVTAIGIGADPPAWWTYTTARLGVDVVVVSHLTLGGNLAFWSVNTDPGPDTTGFLIYPRVGYVIAFNRTWGFWPRGGITFRDIGGNDEVALTFEATFFAAAVEHFGFTFGPVFDIGIAGDGPESRSFGLIAGGLFGWL
jgi:hypothetical protein